MDSAKTSIIDNCELNSNLQLEESEIISLIASCIFCGYIDFIHDEYDVLSNDDTNDSEYVIKLVKSNMQIVNGTIFTDFTHMIDVYSSIVEIENT